MNVAARRAALTFIFCCTSPGLFATDVESPTRDSSSSLRPFLISGSAATRQPQVPNPHTELEQSVLLPAMPNEVASADPGTSLAELIRDTNTEQPPVSSHREPVSPNRERSNSEVHFALPTRVPVPEPVMPSTTLPATPVVASVEPAWQELPELESTEESSSADAPVLVRARPRITKVAAPESGGESQASHGVEPASSDDSRPAEDPILSPTTSITLHTTRLQENAHRLLMDSQRSLQRGATRTARKHAMEALQQIIAMRDAEEGGNLHSLQLKSAFDAIRESKDFCGEFGYIDTSALERMVNVHETSVLKQQDLTRISALQATNSYLEHARSQLVLAAGGVRAASEALTLLGQIELQVAGTSSTHATSVAVAFQRAAIEADPTLAVGYQVLGTTLASLGLNAEAASYLITGLRMSPTRAGYERLLEVARRTGDADTSRICVQSLEDPRMEDTNLVMNLTPQQFAATYRPKTRTVEATPVSVTHRETKSEPSADRSGLRSLFSIGGR